MKIDEKVKFFLKNQKQIEEWNNIRKRAVDAANEFFVSLKPDIEDLAQKLGGDVQCCADFECSTPKYYLFNKGWCSQSNDDVPIGVNFEWSKNNSAFLGACSGIWIHAKAENYDKLSPIYFEAIRGVKTTGKYIPQFKGWWALYRDEKPSNEEYWDNLDEFKEEILASLNEEWMTFSEAMDNAYKEYLLQK